MKLITMILALFCASPVFSENLQVNITPNKPQHSGVHFAVVAEPEKLVHDQFRICWVVVAVTPSDKSTASQTAYLEVWNGNQFVCSSVLPSCKPTDIPINLKKQIKNDGAIFFSFKINPVYLKKSWFGYQIGKNAAGSEPTDCVIHLEEFIMMPNKASEAIGAQGAPQPQRGELLRPVR